MKILDNLLTMFVGILFWEFGKWLAAWNWKMNKKYEKKSGMVWHFKRDENNNWKKEPD